jgi:hypothetical protein
MSVTGNFFSAIRTNTTYASVCVCVCVCVTVSTCEPSWCPRWCQWKGGGIRKTAVRGTGRNRDRTTVIMIATDVVVGATVHSPYWHVLSQKQEKLLAESRRRIDGITPDSAIQARLVSYCIVVDKASSRRLAPRLPLSPGEWQAPIRVLTSLIP